MATETDICNLALAKLGDSATVASINPPEGSAQAEHCARFYPIARDFLLESHPWKWAVRRVALARLSSSSWNWLYVYAVPSDMLRVLAVLPPSQSSDSYEQHFEMEADENGVLVIRTDQKDATLKYIARVVDTMLYTPSFIDALSWLLASYLAGPLIKGSPGAEMAKYCLEAYRLAYASARTIDSNQRDTMPEHKPEWISDR